MLFGSEKTGGIKGITLDGDLLELRVVDVATGLDGTPDWEAAGVIVHNARNRSIAHMLIEMPFGPYPMALGVIYDHPQPTFESGVIEERRQASAGKEPSLAKLLAKGQTWTVDSTAADPV